MTGPDDVWHQRRSWGDRLGRWAGRTPRPWDKPVAPHQPHHSRVDPQALLRRARAWCRERRLWKQPDRGSATILVLAFGLVFVAAGVAGAAVGAARIGRHQAQVAADLGALAGAAHAIEGQAAACGLAARYVEANGGRLAGCQVDGLDVVVDVELTVDLPLGFPRQAHAAARAGPLSSGPG
jgi:secretion/DNA translocation related TadE-like protein